MESGRGAIEQKKEEQGKMSGKERGREWRASERISIRLSPLMDDPVSPKAAATSPFSSSVSAAFLRPSVSFPERGGEGEEAEEGMHNFSQQQHMSSPPAPSRASCPPRRLSPRARPRRRRRVARCPHFPPPPRIVNGWGTDGDNISLGRAEGRQERGRGGGTEGEERSNGPETTRADWMTTSEREGAGK